MSGTSANGVSHVMAYLVNGNEKYLLPICAKDLKIAPSAKPPIVAVGSDSTSVLVRYNSRHASWLVVGIVFDTAAGGTDACC